MSVERIAPLGQTTMDPLSTMRPVTGPVFEHGRASRAIFAPALPDEGPSHLFDSFILPLPALEAEAGGQTAARVSALYREAVAGGAVVSLASGRLPEAALRHAIETLMTHLAEAHHATAPELIAGAKKIEPALLPSHNDEAAQFTFKGRLTASDADGKLRPLDLYLTRIGVGEWEAAAYERTPARAAHLFPRPGPPIDVHRLVIDPDSARVRACIPWGSPTGVSVEARRPLRHVAAYFRMIAAVIFAVALTTFFAHGLSWETGALLLAALVLALARI